MKGITPIISIIILLLITIGLASAAWTYMSGYMTGLLSRALDVSSSPSCIGGITVSFIVKNIGTNNVGAQSVNCLNLDSGLTETLTWQWLNGTNAGTPVLPPGTSIMATMVKPCTSTGIANTCKYELTLTGTTWKQELPVYCTG
jgi:flagellin-like protein